MFYQYRFSFDRDFCNVYGQVIIPAGMMGWVTLNGIMADLSCDRDIPGYRTRWMSIRQDLLKDSIRIEIPIV